MRMTFMLLTAFCVYLPIEVSAESIEDFSIYFTCKGTYQDDTSRLLGGQPIEVHNSFEIENGIVTLGGIDGPPEGSKVIELSVERLVIESDDGQTAIVFRSSGDFRLSKFKPSDYRVSCEKGSPVF